MLNLLGEVAVAVSCIFAVLLRRSVALDRVLQAQTRNKARTLPITTSGETLARNFAIMSSFTK